MNILQTAVETHKKHFSAIFRQTISLFNSGAGLADGASFGCMPTSRPAVWNESNALDPMQPDSVNAIYGRTPMKTKAALCLVAVLIPFFFTTLAAGHCEIPCGIYDDALRVKQIAEHVGTIEKSMKQIIDLSKENPINYNQLVRWVSNKEAHADEIQHIVTRYFMTQRIKPDAKQYAEKLAALHEMLIYAMKCKQTTDFENVNKLRSSLKAFEVLYFGK